MLDDLKYIHQRDSHDALGIAERQWQQLQYNFSLPAIEGKFDNVVYGGMGGSGLAGLLSTSWPGYKVPFEICRSYTAPTYVGPNTLFIASSYSGNTEETLSALARAQEKDASVVVITGGGKLKSIAEEKSYPLLLIPNVEQPRYSVFYMFKALAAVLAAAGLLEEESTKLELNNVSGFIRDSVKDWVATIASQTNPAKQLAQEIAGKSLVVYAGPVFAPVAYKWKINFNENSKNVAWYNEFPEFNHNEMIGWTSHPIEKPYAVIDLRSNLEHSRVQKRFEVTERLLSGQRPAPHIVQAEGETLLEQLLWMVAYGDFVSIYLGLVNGVDPAPVEIVEKFKTELN